jgi:large subunit ribosomal protein L20
MVRVKRGVGALKRRRNVLRRVKGFNLDRKSKERSANDALLHANRHAFAGRKDKKTDYRKLWLVKINAAVREQGMSYSVFINKLKVANVTLDRKVLAQIAQEQPKVFAKIAEKVK